MAVTCGSTAWLETRLAASLLTLTIWENLVGLAEMAFTTDFFFVYRSNSHPKEDYCDGCYDQQHKESYCDTDKHGSV